MRLYTKCKNCRSEIKFRVNAADRFVLVKKRGEKINLTCKHCNSSKSYHVNDIKAQESKLIGIIALLIFIGGTVGIFIYLWPYFFRTSYIYAISGLVGLLIVPFLVYQAINSGQSNKIQYFNIKKYG